MKYLKIGKYELYAVIIIAFAMGLRILLAASGWPPTNSDEGTMGIMARHIAYNGEHPLVFYGQDYMGSLEAYVGAFFFHIFGPSLFSLRLGVILLFTLFLSVMYLFAGLLYSKQIALGVLVLLSVGSIYMFTRQMIATGGSMETLLFGILAFLLSLWLSLNYRRNASFRTKLWRLIVYSSLGVVVGLGFWSDMVVLPTFIMASILLLIFCWRELLLRGWPFLFIGFLIGSLPIIYYNIDISTRDINSLIILNKLFHGTISTAPTTLRGVLHGFKGTVLISIPTATGNPFCPVMEPAFLGDNTPQTPACTLEHTSWGVGYLALLVASLFVTLRALWRLLQLRLRKQFDRTVVDQRDTLVRRVAQLILLGSAFIAIIAFAFSEAPTDWPAFHARYLITLLIVTPAIIAPLLTTALMYSPQMSRLSRVKWGASCGVLALIAVLLVMGTGILFSEVPATQASNQRQADLINKLTIIGATHIYSDYWTCDNISFVSNEKIICGAVENNLHRHHNNRVVGYYEIVSSDPHSAYVLLTTDDQVPALERMVKESKRRYHRFVFDGYLIYQPQ